MEVVARKGVPGVLAGAFKDGRWWTGSAGFADESGRPPRPDDHFRAGSVTKTFLATVVLQLEAEGRLALDDSVEKWLPGMVRGNGNDGRAISIRQLLNHTSGLYDYLGDPAVRYGGTQWLPHRYDTWKPEQLVAIAVNHPPAFAPGADWDYSNTNYVLSALIVERVTGRSYESELRRRVIGPLGLRGTVAPGTDATLPAPAGRAYTQYDDDPDLTVHDVTEYNPSIIRGAGDLITTTRDLDRFLAALLRGALLPPAQMKKMTTIAPRSEDYGLGLFTVPTPCGVPLWGHNGMFAGTETWTLSTRDARHRLTLSFNTDRFFGAGAAGEIIAAEFCSSPPR
ncbi:serine hydrolase domain-containing protein [Streptomyces sp. URMC 123]|uniref:serine hydrolase domain-containing protein n=1 Tax=Streptomyces sp. URMC 123 TaxID=3423403 RepID=UPI003F1B0C1D